MITEEYIPFHKVIKLLEDFTDRHIDLNAFGFGNLLEYGKDIEDRTLLYPVLFVVPQTITYDEQQTQYSLSVIIADRLSEDERNRVDAISNMSMIAKDLIGEIKLGGLQDYFDVDLPITSTSFIERFMDNVGGVALDITLTSLDPLNVCESFLEPVEYNPSQIEGLFAWYDLQDTSTITLTGGTDITQLLDKSGNDYTLTPLVNPPSYQQISGGNLDGYYSMLDTDFTGLGHNFSSPITTSGHTIFVVSDAELTDSLRNGFGISTGNTFTSLIDYRDKSVGNMWLSVNPIIVGYDWQLQYAGGISGEGYYILTQSQDNSSGLTSNIYGVESKTATNLNSFPNINNEFDYIILGDVMSIFTLGDKNYFEAIMYDRKLTDDEYNGVLQYLKNKYKYQYWV